MLSVSLNKNISFPYVGLGGGGGQSICVRYAMEHVSVNLSMDLIILFDDRLSSL